MSKSERELPKSGDRIPPEKFFVSKMNVRINESFGETPEDEALTKHLTWRDIVQPFKARPEDENGHWEPGMDLSLMKGYGVVIGGRRFQGKRKVAKYFVVGKDCLIEEMTDAEALDASLLENLKLFRSELNPIARAKGLSQLIDMKLTGLKGGLRGLARRWRIPASTLSEWLKPLELNLKMQEVTAKGLVHHTDAVQVARLELGTELQDKLAEIVETQGYDPFKSEVARLREGKGKRGIRAGVWDVDRVLWDRRNRKEMEHVKVVDRAAEKKGFVDEKSGKVKRPEYIKDFIIRHIDDIAKEAA